MNGLSRVTAILSFGMAVIGCVAAVVVVPEVRCALGMEEGQVLREGRCRKESAAGPALGFGFLPVSPPGAMSLMQPGSLADHADEMMLRRIRREYQEIESRREWLQTWRQEIEGSGAESAYANIWSEDGAIRLIRGRFHRDGHRQAVLLYYRHGELFFVHQLLKRIGPGGEETTLDEQRFYFADGKLVRWLDGNRAGVPASTAEYAENERRLRELAAALMRGARSPNRSIRL
jgi:hypothetical protein